MRRVSCTYIATLIICLLPLASGCGAFPTGRAVSLRPPPSPVPTAERSVAPQRHDEVVVRETIISILSNRTCARVLTLSTVFPICGWIAQVTVGPLRRTWCCDCSGR
jgi:hypothetical protein